MTMISMVGKENQDSVPKTFANILQTAPTQKDKNEVSDGDEKNKNQDKDNDHNIQLENSLNK